MSTYQHAGLGFQYERNTKLMGIPTRNDIKILSANSFCTSFFIALSYGLRFRWCLKLLVHFHFLTFKLCEISRPVRKLVGQNRSLRLFSRFLSYSMENTLNEKNQNCSRGIRMLSYINKF